MPTCVLCGKESGTYRGVAICEKAYRTRALGESTMLPEKVPDEWEWQFLGWADDPPEGKLVAIYVPLDYTCD
jgi:hypothetical protein